MNGPNHVYSEDLVYVSISIPLLFFCPFYSPSTDSGSPDAARSALVKT